MIYACVHDQTVADDYYAAMEWVEQRLELLGAPQETSESIGETERGQLLALTAQLTAPMLSLKARLEIAALMRLLLVGGEMVPLEVSENGNGRKQWEHPPPSPVLLEQP
jgi:hypothetical protein